MNDLIVNSVWAHIEKGTSYMIVETGKMLSDSHWIHSVSYKQYGDANGTLYTRSQESFREKFTRVAKT